MRSRLGNSSVLPTSKKMTWIFGFMRVAELNSFSVVETGHAPSWETRQAAPLQEYLKVRAPAGPWLHLPHPSKNRVAENDGRRSTVVSGPKECGLPGNAELKTCRNELN